MFDFDFGRYLIGIFYASAGIMIGYGVVTSVKSIKGIIPPLIILALMVAVMWWHGERFDFIWSMLRI